MKSKLNSGLGIGKIRIIVISEIVDLYFMRAVLPNLLNSLCTGLLTASRGEPDNACLYTYMTHDIHNVSTRGCHAHINCGEICDHTVKVLTENFYCSIALIKLLRVLSLKFCLTLDRFGSKHQRNVVA